MNRIIMLLVFMTCLSSANAGSVYKLSCISPETKCEFTTTLVFGGTMSGSILNGFCKETSKFVVLRTANPKPVKVITDSDGKKIKLYAFPDCPNPTAAFRKPSDITECPICPEAKPVLIKRGYLD